MLVYLIAGVALIGALLGFVGYERKAGGDSVRAELQPKLTACQSQVSEMGKQIEGQNKAVEALKSQGDQKAKEAAKALQQAEGKAKVWQDQTKRLQAVLVNRQPSGPKDCKTAWEEIRK